MSLDMQTHDNPFEIDNAKNLDREQLVQTFVPTEKFSRLLEPKHHVILGSRGSGKTALAKMLSHDHLVHLDHPKAKRLIKAKELIGVYVPTNVEWVGALKNKPWRNADEMERFFRWRLNLATCAAFLTTLRSCLETYVPDTGNRARKERTIVGDIAQRWFTEGANCTDVRSLVTRLRDIAASAEREAAKARVCGEPLQPESTVELSFATEFFQPLRQAATIVAEQLDFPNSCKWIICIDEAEFLDVAHQRILNTYMRGYTSEPALVFKITTMPYCHYTLDTNLDVPLNLGHDFEYIYIDEDPVQPEYGENFARELLSKRLRVGKLGSKLDLKLLLGESPLLDRRPKTWHPDSKEMRLLRSYGSQETIARAEKLLAYPTKFRDEISRKIYAALILRDAAKQKRGRQSLGLYSGATTVVRCADGNPRRLLRILNRFWLEGGKDKNGRLKKLSSKEQESILKQFSKSTLLQVKSEPGIGPELHQLLEVIGRYMRDRLYNAPLTTDQVTSIVVDLQIDDKYVMAVERAVALGLLYPNRNPNDPDHIPRKGGKFHLAYVLAPHFGVLPRRESARSLMSILSASQKGQKVMQALQQQLQLV